MSGIKKRRINEEESKMARNGKNGEGDPIGNGTVMDGENNPVGMVKENILYNNNDEGPYRVMVELQDNKEGEIRINKLSLAQTLQKMIVYKGHITEVKQAGRQKVMVYLNNYQLANRLTTDKDFNQRNYRAYIPKHLVAVNGVLAGIPLDMKDEDVMNGIISEVPVLGVKRLTRFIDGRREPTQRVSVTFRAKKIPSLVKVFCCSMKIRAFYRKTVLCLNCLRYSHRAENCRSRTRCRNCSGIHDDPAENELCQNAKKCLHCRTNHKTEDIECPERKRQNNIQSIMARSNLTYIEATEQFPILTQNYYEALLEGAEDPTPAESFATMTAGSFKWKPPPRKAVQRRPEPNVRSTIISEQVKVYNSKKNPTANTSNGVALFNKYKVTEAEKWKEELRSAAAAAAAKQQDPSTSAIQIKLTSAPAGKTTAMCELHLQDEEMNENRTPASTSN